MVESYTGAGALIIYAMESAYGTLSTAYVTPVQGTGPYHFGIGEEVSDVGFDNQVGSVYGLGDREAAALYPGTFKGAMSVDFDLCFAGATTAGGLELPWLDCILGGYGSPTYSKGTSVKSMSIRIGINQTPTDVDYEWYTDYLGCVVNRASFTFETGGVAHVKLDVLYANQSTVTGASYTDNAYARSRTYPITFCGIVMDTDLFGVVERADLTIEAGTDLIYGLGSRAGQAKKEGTLNYKVTATNLYNDPTKILGLALGDITTPMTVKTDGLDDITNGITITASDNATPAKTLTINLTNAKVASHKTTPIKTGEAIMEEVEIVGRTLTIAHPT
jgi:hypothetical protein